MHLEVENVQLPVFEKGAGGKKVADPTKPEKHLCGLEKRQAEAGLTQAAKLEQTCFYLTSPHAPQHGPFFFFF